MWFSASGGSYGRLKRKLAFSDLDDGVSGRHLVSFPRTQNEVSAGVVPLAPEFEELNVHRYWNSSHVDWSVAIRSARDVAKVSGGVVQLENKEYIVSLEVGTVAKDTFLGIGAAIELPSWVGFRGRGIGTSGGVETGTRIRLADGQNCNVFGSFENAATGLHGCLFENIMVHGNRLNQTTGSGIFVGSWYSNNVFRNLKVGECKDNFIRVQGASIPINIDTFFGGASGGHGIYLGGVSTTGVNLMNVQIDNAGLDGGGNVGGIYLDQGSTQDTNILLTNYRYEENINGGLTPTSHGIVINNANLCAFSVVGSYGFTNNVAASDYIKIMGSDVRLNLFGITCDSDYTNIINDTVNGRVVPYGSVGVPVFCEDMSIQSTLRVLNRSTGAIATNAIDATSHQRVNHSGDGATLAFVDWFAGSTTKIKSLGNTGNVWIKGANSQGGTEGGPAFRIITGLGNPENVEVGTVGWMYIRTDGGTGAVLYIKESGVGDTGWVAK